MVARTPLRMQNSAPFSTSSFLKAALAQDLPAQPTVLLDTPSADYIREEELDVELIPPEQVKLVITDRAAEVSYELVYWALSMSTTIHHSAIEVNSHEGEQPCGCASNSGRVWWMSWVSVQDGAG